MTTSIYSRGITPMTTAEFSAKAGRVIPADVSRSKVLTVVFAIAVARKLPIPSAATHDDGGYFTLNLKQSADAMLSELNERIMFDPIAASEYVRQFWRLRYLATHGNYNTVLSMPPGRSGFVDTLVGAGQALSEEVHCFSNTDGVRESIFALLPDAMALLASEE